MKFIFLRKKDLMSEGSERVKSFFLSKIIFICLRRISSIIYIFKTCKMFSLFCILFAIVILTMGQFVKEEGKYDVSRVHKITKLLVVLIGINL